MRIKAIKYEARKALKGHWGLAILISILAFSINSFVPLLMEILFTGGFNEWFNQPDAPSSAQFISWIFTIALCPIMFGYSTTFLAMVRSEPVGIKNLFAAFDSTIYFKIIGLYLLTSIYTLLWTLLLIIPGIIKSMAYSQTYYILKDHPELSPNAAITKSRQLMKGYKGKYFLLMLSFFGWGILSVITLGIGFIWLIPYTTASLAAFYENLSGEKEVII